MNEGKWISTIAGIMALILSMTTGEMFRVILSFFICLSLLGSSDMASLSVTLTLMWHSPRLDSHRFSSIGILEYTNISSKQDIGWLKPVQNTIVALLDIHSLLALPTMKLSFLLATISLIIQGTYGRKLWHHSEGKSSKRFGSKSSKSNWRGWHRRYYGHWYDDEYWWGSKSA